MTKYNCHGYLKKIPLFDIQIIIAQIVIQTLVEYQTLNGMGDKTIDISHWNIFSQVKS